MRDAQQAAGIALAYGEEAELLNGMTVIVDCIRQRIKKYLRRLWKGYAMLAPGWLGFSAHPKRRGSLFKPRLSVPA